jgi:PPOX class probable F420-dependent enzyme
VSPHTTLVWVDVDEDGAVSVNTAHGRAKPRYIAKDPRVSLLVPDGENPYRWLSITGTAELDEEGAEEQIDRLAKKYLGQDTYPYRQAGERRVSLRIRAERIDSYGFEAPA